MPESSFSLPLSTALPLSNSTHFASYQVAQFLKVDSSEDFSDFSSFLFKNYPILLFALLGCLSLVLVSLVCPSIVATNYDRAKSLKLVLFHIFFLDHSQLPRVSMKFALIFLGVNLFLFFDLLFLTGTIKTEKVIVPTR